jgi:glutathione synthase/RimK-type ligase-like ATP-grasp enzyme
MCPVIAEEAGLGVYKTGDVIEERNPEYIFRWGTTAGVENGPKIVNKIKAISETCDKRRFRAKLADKGLAPFTWTDVEAFKKDAGNKEFDVLIRPGMHERSEGIYRCTNAWDVMDAINKCGYEYYISQYIKKTQEFRVFVVSGRVAWVIEKTPANKEDVSWGCVNAGQFEYVAWQDWPLAIVQNAVDAFYQSDLDFGAVDVMLDAEGRAYTLEINTAPYLTPYYARTIGKTFKWIMEKGRDRFEQKTFETWRDAKHPAIG